MIEELNLGFIDGSTIIDANKLNAIVGKINEMVAIFNSGSTTPVTVDPVVPTITLNTTSKEVTLSATTGLVIMYSTTSGDTPSTMYTSAIDVHNGFDVVNIIGNGATIKAITSNGTTTSTVPVISIVYDEGDGTISFVTTETGTITYTTDGTDPISSSTSYSSAITPVAQTTYKIGVFNNGILVSEIATVQIQ